MENPPLRFAVVGCGFWAHFQTAAWYEIGGVQLVAVCDPDEEKARDLAQKYPDVARFGQLSELLISYPVLDFIDVISGVNSHYEIVKVVADAGIPVICQKPMTHNLATARKLVAYCSALGVPFFVHENFRWQRQIRAVKAILDSGALGKLFQLKISFCSAFDVYANQPALATTEHFVLTDIGSHFLDELRFLVGEIQSLYCITHQVNPNIRGEDVAHVMAVSRSGQTASLDLSYASVRERDAFPETHILAEGENGSLRLGSSYTLALTVKRSALESNLATDEKISYFEVLKKSIGWGDHHPFLSAPLREEQREDRFTLYFDVSPHRYDWADPDYAVFHAAIVDCNRDILTHLRGEKTAETTGADNLRTVELVWGCYASASENKSIQFP